MYDITIFTPTYNRAYILPNLYKSLVNQYTKKKFEWLIIDDGSKDNTESLVKEWINECKIIIHYYKIPNGGKCRAINLAIKLAKSPFLFIIDSDDYLADDNVIDFMIKECHKIECNDKFIGVAGLRSSQLNKMPHFLKFNRYIDATNLERAKYGLDIECNEAYKINVLKKYPFIVWPSETFSPEQIVFDSIALDGYKIRWHKRIIVISEYLDDGLTKGALSLIKKNPMGYALLYNHKLKIDHNLKDRIYDASQLIAQSILGYHPLYFLKSNDPYLACLCYPLGIVIAIRRIIQFSRH